MSTLRSRCRAVLLLVLAAVLVSISCAPHAGTRDLDFPTNRGEVHPSRVSGSSIRSLDPLPDSLLSHPYGLAAFDWRVNSAN